MTTRRFLKEIVLSLFQFIPSASWSSYLSNGMLGMSNLAAGRTRQIQAKKDRFDLPEIQAADESERLTSHILERRPPWWNLGVEASGIPNMISQEEIRYYEYLGRFYRGFGEVVELGPWLGASTFHILAGLNQNPHFVGKKLQVFDDFIWRTWMDPHLPEGVRAPDPGSSFRPLFDQYMGDLLDRMEVFENKIVLYEGNDSVPDFSWDGRKIEMCFVDCGRTLEVNSAWYRKLERSFIPKRTLIILQDWHTFEELPPRWYNQIKMFTDSLGETLSLVHELRRGGTATFLFRG